MEATSENEDQFDNLEKSEKHLMHVSLTDIQQVVEYMKKSMISR